MKLFKSAISDPFRIALSGVLVKILEVTRGLVILSVLSLEQYSLISLINQIKAFTKYGNIGFIDVVRNEYNYEKINNSSKAKKIFNNGLTADFIVQVLISLMIIFIAGWSENNTIIKIGLVFSAFNYLLLKIWSYYEIEATFNKSYKKLSKILILSSSTNEVLTIMFLFIFGIWSPLLVPPISLLTLLLIYYKKNGPAFDIKINLKEIYRQFKKGILLSILTILTGFCFIIERKITFNILGVEKFGLYGLLLFVFGVVQVIHKNFNLPNTILNREFLASHNFKKVYKVLFKNVFIIIFFISPFLIFMGTKVLEFVLINLLSKYIILIPIIPFFLLFTFNKLLINHFGYIIYAEGIYRLKWMYIVLIIEILTLSLAMFFVTFTDLLEVVQFLSVLSFFKAFVIILLTHISIKVSVIKSVLNSILIACYPQIIFYAINITNF